MSDVTVDASDQGVLLSRAEYESLTAFAAAQKWPRPPQGDVQPCGHALSRRRADGSCQSCARAIRDAEKRKRFCQECGAPVGPRLSYCDTCNRGRARQRDRDRPPRAIKADTRTNYAYGLTREEYLAIMAGPCGICGQRVARMHLDHDHSCCPQSARTCGNCIRGVLCHRCNLGLGYYEGWFQEHRENINAWIENGGPK